MARFPLGTAPRPREGRLHLPAVYVAPPSGDATGVTDAAAISAAISTLPSGKGIVHFRGGVYHDLARTLPNYTIFQGEGGVSAGAVPGTLLEYVGADAAYLNCQTTVGIQLRDMMVYGNNAGFTGRLIDLSNGASLPRLRDCYLGVVDTSAAVIAYLDDCRDVGVDGCNIVGGKYGIQGIASSGHYCNGVDIHGGTRIGGQGTAGICGMGAAWNVTAVFELQSGQNGINAGPSPSQGGSIHGCYFGDATGTPTAVQVFGNGLVIAGNFIGSASSSAGKCVQFVGTSDGVSVKGNYMIDALLGIDKNGQTVTNVELGPNSYTAVGTHHNFTPAGAPYVEA